MESLHNYIQPEKRLAALLENFNRLKELLPSDIQQQINQDLTTAQRFKPSLVAQSELFAEIYNRVRYKLDDYGSGIE